MPATRVLVCSPANYELVVAGLTTLGWPANACTRRFVANDLAVFQEYDATARLYTGRQCARVITSVQFRRKGGHILLALRELKEGGKTNCTR